MDKLDLLLVLAASGDWDMNAIVTSAALSAALLLRNRVHCVGAPTTAFSACIGLQLLHVE